MKFLSFKILLLCILLPPVSYILSVEVIQRIYIDSHLKGVFTREIQDIGVGDTRPLFEGNIRLKDAIQENVRAYLRSKKLVISLGLALNITVITKRGTIIYPPIFEIRRDLLSPDPVVIAADNLKLMNEGLVVNVDLMLGYMSPLSLILLVFYTSIALAVLYVHYQNGSRRAKAEEARKNKEIGHLKEMEKVRMDELDSLERDREQLVSEFERIRNSLEKEKEQALRNEDEMVAEIITLEERIQRNLALQDTQKSEIESLKEQISLSETKGRRKESGGKKDSMSMLQKRFKALYKNISIHQRAVSGFSNLDEEQKIKGEELIHQLNEDPGLIPIKRKVFGKKGRQTVLEIVFAYKGRLYFRKTKDGKIEILTIGTKNTQTKDLEFLNNL
ncbi:hypothetical protein DENIS_0198 [Desulfonema ishimotonii]|uniref:Uncharacterized protein n=1 Tax=Desulfonema ishimotonii TaxID=45657 RepID=A0A401FQN8_9BACT|nr:hypothetical protein [Desulfonema ishimotonii]GBC59262.1 hypothetical protein DENIS_0198 [Desulfonema ishimotonii]